MSFGSWLKGVLLLATVALLRSVELLLAAAASFVYPHFYTAVLELLAETGSDISELPLA